MVNVVVMVIDDAEVSRFLVVAEEMVMMTVMPRFVGFWPVKSTNLVVSEEMVQCYEICCYVLLYLWEYIVARIRENVSPRFVGDIYGRFIDDDKCGFIGCRCTGLAI